MTSIRPTSPSAPIARVRAHPSPVAATPPVFFEPDVEADRRRSLQEDLDAGEERVPVLVEDDDAAAGAHALAGELERLGDAALRLLHPVVPEVWRLIDGTHVDERA